MPAGFIQDTKPTREADQLELIELVNVLHTAPGLCTRPQLKALAVMYGWSAVVTQKLDEILIEAFEGNEWECLESGHWTKAKAKRYREEIGL